MMDLGSDEWLLSDVGDYHTAAVETMQKNGSNWQQVIALEWPCRVNHTGDLRTLRLMISPEDAIGLAEVLEHSARWLIAQRTRG